MTNVTKQELVEVLHNEFKDRPLNSDLEKFATKDGLTRLEQRFDGLEQRFDGLEHRFDGLEKKVDGLEKKVDRLENRFDGLEKKVDQLDEKFDDMGRTIVDAIERSMSVKADKTDVEDLSKRVNTLEIEVLAN